MPILKNLQQHKALLDTHVWFWLMQAEKKLSKSFVDSISQCRERDQVFISAISVWEIGMLFARKRIELDIDCMDWIEIALAIPGVNLTPLSPKIAVQSTRLPEEIHGDPADRILVATAHEYNAVLVTHDKEIIKYGKGSFINVYDPC